MGHAVTAWLALACALLFKPVRLSSRGTQARGAADNRQGFSAVLLNTVAEHTAVQCKSAMAPWEGSDGEGGVHPLHFHNIVVDSRLHPCRRWCVEFQPAMTPSVRTSLLGLDL